MPRRRSSHRQSTDRLAMFRPARNGAVVSLLPDRLRRRALPLTPVSGESLEIRRLLSGTASEAAAPTPRIIGGNEVTPGEYPFMISMQTQTGFHFCGGILIRPDWVLTAAHCNPDTTAGLQLVAGVQDLRTVDSDPAVQVRSAEQVFIHPDFARSPYLTADVALIKLDRPFEITDRVQTIDFARPEDAESFEEGDPVIVTGWGRIFENGPASNVLREATSAISDFELSSQIYVDTFGAPLDEEAHIPLIDPESGFGGSGQGDSGGPLLVLDENGDLIVAGLTSFGIQTADRPDVPGVYARVATYADYIEGVLAAENPNSSLSGRVFVDTDGNGSFGEGDIPLGDQTVFLDLNGNGVRDSNASADVFTSDGAVNLPDLDTATATITIDDEIDINDLNVSMNIQHPFSYDLVITLTSPSGTEVTLFEVTNFAGIGSDLFATFDDESPIPIENGVAPYAGVFRPVEPLAAFDGESTEGEWTLTLTDIIGGGSGTLFDWNITVNGGIDEPTAQTTPGGTYTFENLTPALYTVGLDDPSGEFVFTSPQNGLQQVQVAAEQSRTGLNFGVQGTGGQDDLVAINPLDGRIYVARSTGTEFENQNFGFASGGDLRLLGDVNGDGRDDLITVDGDIPFAEISRRSRFESTPDQIIGDLPASFGSSSTSVVGDFNGDGLADVINWQEQTGTITLFERTDFGFEASRVGSVDTASFENLLVGDFDGDGSDDIALRSSTTGTWFVGFGGDDLADNGFTYDNFGTYNPEVGFDTFLVGDFNGDGLDDITARVSSNGAMYIGLSNGDLFAARVWDVFNPNATFETFRVGDFNGDGLDDLFSRVAENGGTYVSFSNGTRFLSQSQGTIPDVFVDYVVGDYDGDGADDLSVRNGDNGVIVNGLFNGTRLEFSVWGRWSPIDWDVIGAFDVSGPTSTGQIDNTGGTGTPTPNSRAATIPPAATDTDDEAVVLLDTLFESGEA